MIESGWAFPGNVKSASFSGAHEVGQEFITREPEAVLRDWLPCESGHFASNRSGKLGIVNVAVILPGRCASRSLRRLRGRRDGGLVLYKYIWFFVEVCFKVLYRRYVRTKRMPHSDQEIENPETTQVLHTLSPLDLASNPGLLGS